MTPVNKDLFDEKGKPEKIEEYVETLKGVQAVKEIEAEEYIEIKAFQNPDGKLVTEKTMFRRRGNDQIPVYVQRDGEVHAEALRISTNEWALLEEERVKKYFEDKVNFQKAQDERKEQMLKRLRAKLNLTTEEINYLIHGG